MIILVTGGAGFIGSHLCEFLLAKNHKVICVDNLITGSLDNIKNALNNKRFKFIKHDVSKPINIDKKIDFVLHFASPASPKDYLEHPIQTLKVGSLGTHNALGIAKTKKAKFLLASTSEVYGDPKIHPQNENYYGNVNCVGPRGCYDEAKRFAESITMAYHRVHKVNTRIIRIFNTYGPRMQVDDGRVVPNFISQALKNKPLTIYGKGSQTRSFCYIDDLVEGIYYVMNCNYNLPINLGNPVEMTVLDFAKSILKLIPESKSKLKYLPLPQDDPKVRCPNIALAKKLLNWQPKVGLITGLSKTISYFRCK
ncbi:MAG: UDP-glucuronic acid decarboxylase family protein [Candidatus Omnitrophota bacterium]